MPFRCKNIGRCSTVLFCIVALIAACSGQPAPVDEPNPAAEVVTEASPEIPSVTNTVDVPLR